MKQPDFAERLAYARFWMHLRTGRPPTNAEIAEAVGRTSAWVTKWAVSPTPPRDFEVHTPLAEFLDVDERWLVRGVGEPPNPVVWHEWVNQRGGEHEPAHIRLAREHGREVAKGSTEMPGEKLPEKKTAAGGKRPRKR